MNALNHDRLRYFWPNFVTFLSALSALFAIGLAFERQSLQAAYCLLFSGLCDALDGVIAKQLNATSQFGSLYDSMVDFLAFGIAPAFCLFFLHRLHPAVALFYILAIQFRLTRYAVQPEASGDPKFFQGLSATECVYFGLLIGFIPGLSYNLGFLAVALLAVYPKKLAPKGLRPLKLILASAVTVYFVYRG